MSATLRSLDISTPAIMAIDPRGLVVRTIAYCRKIAGGKAQTRVTHQLYNHAAQLVGNWDPRLFKQAETEPDTKANLQRLYNLSGMALMTDSVDAGWRLALANEAGVACLSFDSRGSHRRTVYDKLLRAESVSESEAGGDSKAVERITFGEGDSLSAELNCCGRMIRHDDTAGSRQITGYALGGAPLGETRRFLKDLQIPSWPEELPLRDEQLKQDKFSSTTRYSPTNEVLEQIDAMGNRQRYQYDVAGLLKQTYLQLHGSPEQTVLSKIGYNAFGQVENETAGNGVINSARFHPEDGRLIRLFSQHPAAPPLQDLNYDYDPVGNIVRIEDAALATRHFKNQRIEPASSYCYDSLYQLIKATGRESCSPTNGPELPYFQPLPPDPSQMANYVQTFDYDDGGNLFKLVHVGAQQYCREMITASGSNRSLPITEGGPDPDFANSFDLNGNLKRLQPGPDMNWNLRNQLQEITLVSRPDRANDTEWYGYDGDGQRVRKVRTTQARNLVHVAEVLYLPGLEIRTNTDGHEVLYVINVQAGRSSIRVLHWKSALPKDAGNNQLRYGLGDQLGSCVLELDDQARTLSREGYYPYGGTAWFAARSETEGNYKTVRYSGKERDASGLIYYGFRYYVHWWSRWLNPDPGGAVDGLNLYKMVGNNPVSHRDTNGLVKTSAGSPPISDRPASTTRILPPPVPPRPMHGTNGAGRSEVPSSFAPPPDAPIADISPPEKMINVGETPLELIKIKDLSSSFETWLTKHTENDWLVLKDYSSMVALDAKDVVRQRIGASNEVFAFRFSEKLNLNIVPATILQPGEDRQVLSRFVPPTNASINFDRRNSSMYVFDFLLNTRDRIDDGQHGNIVFNHVGKAYAIDHDQILEPGFSAIDANQITDEHLAVFADKSSTMEQFMNTDWGSFFDDHALQDPLINRSQAKEEFVARIEVIRRRLG